MSKLLNASNLTLRYSGIEADFLVLRGMRISHDEWSGSRDE